MQEVLRKEELKFVKLNVARRFMLSRGSAEESLAWTEFDLAEAMSGDKPLLVSTLC